MIAESILNYLTVAAITFFL